MDNLIKYNKDYFLAIANQMVTAKQEMTIREAKLVRLMVSQVVEEDLDLKTFKCNVGELAEFLNLNKTAFYNDIEKICRSLMTRVIEIEDENATGKKKKWKMFHWISTARYDGNGELTIRLSDEIKPFVVGLNKWFTQYQIQNVLELNSVYAIRLYEILRSAYGVTRKNKSKYEYTVEKLREVLCCEKKFNQIGQFKEKVIDRALSEINSKTDICVDVEYKKTGRKISSVIFYVTEN